MPKGQTSISERPAIVNLRLFPSRISRSSFDPLSPRSQDLLRATKEVTWLQKSRFGNGSSERLDVVTVSRQTADARLKIKVIPNVQGTPPSKLADAELEFTDGRLEGLRLIGFAIWERPDGERIVTFPARQYSVNGERRSFALLRSQADASAQEPLRDSILQAFADYNGSQEGELS